MVAHLSNLALLVSLFCVFPSLSQCQRRGDRVPLRPNSGSGDAKDDATPDQVNYFRVVNGQAPIDFTSPDYPLEELGHPVGDPPPKLPVPEIYPLSEHLDYPTPLTVLTTKTPTASYPYVNQRIHYKICVYNTTLCESGAPADHLPNRNWRSVLPGQSLSLSADDADDWREGLSLTSILIMRPIKLTLALFASSGWDGDREPELNATIHHTDSDVTVRDYYISDGRVGTAFLAPNYNGKEFTGDMAEVDLNTEKYSTVRIHGIESDFADYYSKSETSTDGVNPYVKQTSKSKTDQVVIKRLKNLDPDLSGYQGGFGALYGTLSYGFLVPFFNGKEHFGKVIRVNCGNFNNTGSIDDWYESTTFREFRTVASTTVVNDNDGNPRTVYDYEDFTKDTDFRGVDVLDLTTVDPDLKGFIGGFSHGEYAYFVPFMNGKVYSSKLVRVHVHNFDAAHATVLDLSLKDRRLAGFYGGFATNLVPGGALGPANNYAYLVPYKNVVGKIDGINTKLTADGYKDYNIFDEQERYVINHWAPFSSLILI